MGHLPALSSVFASMFVSIVFCNFSSSCSAWNYPNVLLRAVCRREARANQPWLLFVPAGSGRRIRPRGRPAGTLTRINHVSCAQRRCLSPNSLGPHFGRYRRSGPVELFWVVWLFILSGRSRSDNSAIVHQAWPLRPRGGGCAVTRAEDSCRR